MNRQIIDLSQNELLNYIVDNFKEDALLEISYNRVFIPGKILYIDKSSDVIITLQLMGRLLHQRVDININEIIDEIVELRYTYHEMEVIIRLS